MQLLSFPCGRDDALAYINSSYGGYSPALLVAIQFHWPWGAVRLLANGADPATHWNKKLVMMHTITSIKNY